MMNFYHYSVELYNEDIVNADRVASKIIMCILHVFLISLNFSYQLLLHKIEEKYV